MLLCVLFLKEFYVSFTPLFCECKVAPMLGVKLHWDGAILTLILNLGLDNKWRVSYPAALPPDSTYRYPLNTVVELLGPGSVLKALEERKAA